jgi:aerobic-type carbon monoxide dehydrogenase small subunit (CoxS/CutS family)
MTASLRLSPGDKEPRMSDQVPARQLQFEVNGERVSAFAEDRMQACDVLRERLGLNGTRVGCEQGVCGACTILVDGRSRRSCLMFAPQLEGTDVWTVEGLEQSQDGMHPLQEAFRRHHALQCGFCTAGFLMSALELLRSRQGLTEEDVRDYLSGNLCRCTGYQGIIDAVLEVDRQWER